MKRRRGKGMVWAMSMSMALLTAGCGGQSGAGTEHARSSTGDAIQTMGRYIETEADLSVQLEDTAGIYKMQDGKLVIVGRQGAFLVSEDGGETWKSGEGQQIGERTADSYLMDVKVDSKGNAGIIYMENDGEEERVPESASQPAVRCEFLLADGTVVPIDFSGAEERESIDRFWISGTDRYFVSTMEGSIYEVKEDGSSALYLMTEGCPQTIQFQGDLMIIDGYGLKAPLLYDMEKKAYVEDEVLTEFVQDNYEERGFNGSGWYNLCLFPGEDGVIYLAGRNGLHRHVLGGTVMEQVIDGRLSRLGNP